METSISFEFDDKSFKDAINYFNNPSYDVINNPQEKEMWLKILQLFFYSNKIDSYSDLRKKVISYLYTGKLNTSLITNSGGKDIPNKDEIFVGFSSKKPEIESKFLDQLGSLDVLFQKRDTILKLYKQYLKEVVKIKNTINKIIVYEAPPYTKKDKQISHFFLNGGSYYTQIVEGEIRYKKIPEQEIENFLVEFNSVKNIIFKDTDTTTAKKVQDKSKAVLVRMKKFAKTEIVYIDLILMPLYIESEIRKAWASFDSFNFGDECNRKQLPEILFEWSIEHLKHILDEINFERKESKIFSENCLIAIGAPLNTSISIFEYYVDKNYLLEKTDGIENWTDITRLNAPTAYLKTNMKGTTFPLFKSNVIGGNNLPDSALIKNAFNLIG